MNIEQYKDHLLSRPDIDDILKVEPVEVQKTKDGFAPVVHTLVSGRTMQKYDVHVIGEQNGAKNTFSIPVVVYNQGKSDETVEEMRVQIERPTVESSIETYVKSLPFVGIRNLDVDVVNLTARFDAVEVTGECTGRELKVFAFKPPKKSPTYIILD